MRKDTRGIFFLMDFLRLGKIREWKVVGRNCEGNGEWVSSNRRKMVCRQEGEEGEEEEERSVLVGMEGQRDFCLFVCFFVFMFLFQDKKQRV